MEDQLSPALQKLSDTNRGPLVVVTTYIFLAVSFLAVGTKVWTRLSATRHLEWTDWTILVAWVRKKPLRMRSVSYCLARSALLVRR